MLNLLSKQQQKQVKGSLNNLLQQIIHDPKLNAYIILEPPQSEKIADIFLKTDVKYKELLTSIIPEFEDKGPHLIRLGQSEEFDNWVIDNALFSLWSAIWVSAYDEETIAQHLLRIIAPLDEQDECMIFRAYSPLTFEALTLNLARQQQIKENLEWQVLGMFSAIFSIIDFPEQLTYWSFNAQQLQKQTINLLEPNEITIPLNYLEDEFNFNHFNWDFSLFTEQDLSDSAYHHLLLSVRNAIILRENLLESENLEDIHNVTNKMLESCLQANINDTYYITTFIRTYYDYRDIWYFFLDDLVGVLSNNELNQAEKVENIAVFLHEKEEQIEKGQLIIVNKNE